MSEQLSWTRKQAALTIASASLFFATSGPLARIAEPAHPLLIALGRTALASLLLFLASPLATTRALSQTSRRTRLKVFGAGALLAAHFGLFLTGLATTSFSAAVTLVSLEPVAVVLVAWIAFRERPNSGEWLGVGLAMMGALTTSESGAVGHRIAGDLMVIASVALYGLYVGAAKGLASEIAPGPYATIVYGTSGFILGFICILMALGGQSFEAPPHSVLAIVALAIIPTLGGHTLVQWSARHIPASLVALISPGETVGSLLIGMLWLKQIPSMHEAIGALLVLAGVGCTLAAQRYKT